MKKIITAMMTVLIILMMTFPAFAKDLSVSIDDATASLTKVTVSGQTKALAVTIQLRDENDSIVLMETAGTKDGKFATKFDQLLLTEGKTYTIYVADFEGGSWTTKDVVASKEADTGKDDDTGKKEEDKKESKEDKTESSKKETATPASSVENNPKTGDFDALGLTVFVLLSGFAGFAIAIRFRKQA